MVQLWEDVAGEHVALCHMGIARQDERIDTKGLIGPDFGDDLIRITNNRSPAARPCPSNSCPQIIFNIAVFTCSRPKFSLASNAICLGVQRFAADFCAFISI